MEFEKHELGLEALDKIVGGVLPEGWEKTADMLAPSFKKQYPDATYEEACEILKGYITDPDDYAQVAEYMKKYF